MVRQNQGFRRDLNLSETVNEVLTLSNLGGPSLPNDLRIIQNNLRNTSTLAFSTTSNGFFFFGSDSEFVYTDGDVVGVSTIVEVQPGITTLTPEIDYYVCNSNGLTQFKLSTTAASAGLNTVTVSYASTDIFNFIRKDPVNQENLLNLIRPESLDDEFSFLGGSSINDSFNSVQANIETADFFIDRKYKGSLEDTISNNDIKIEGSVVIEDPAGVNVNVSGLSDENSPGIFIGTTRAFSSDNNPWAQVGTALSTSSSLVSVADLFFYDNIQISGVSAVSDTTVAATTFTHKLPVVINGETYYILLRT
jgi:hypothetical protein